MKKTFTRTIVYHIQQHASLYIFVMALLCGGVLTGALLVNKLSVEQLQPLLNPFIAFETGEKQSILTLLNEHVKGYILLDMAFIFIIWCTGFMLIGLPVAWLIVFAKGMMFGFTTGLFISQYGWEGLWIAIGVVLPQNLLLIPVYVIVCVHAIKITLHLWRRVVTRQAFTPTFRTASLNYTILFGFMLMLVVFGGVIEALIPPYWIKWFHPNS
ncbi:stage II sporulation protein M [Jeotgalibacillus proteolyticus]|uniref:Stage II sporulation protein M n=1 Tax=Jeotgalibacillus proteolyticus TaxID=2082395 RepID=A0A2S5GEE6_9BACL|nr:stage II sporulation protein M [Jeotgalibacillus proteolyticus]PPA71318.1 stage II sporulation protein M [Jeotgalibacillus proteolyticus]